MVDNGAEDALRAALVDLETRLKESESQAPDVRRTCKES